MATPHLDSDAVFGVKNAQVETFARYEPSPAPDGSVRGVPYLTAEYDSCLKPL